MNNKSTYNPAIHHRRSIRLKGYDYSQQGLYFVTLCVKNRHCLFGEIVDQQMILNDAGIMVNKWYHELENKFQDIKCLEHIVMPNHFHCIIENTGNAGPPQPDAPILGEHAGSPLGALIQWFKTMSTNEYIRNVKTNNWPRFDGKLWQRNYWEHIIRDEKSYNRIAEYIINNPKKWGNDSINPTNKNNNE